MRILLILGIIMSFFPACRKNASVSREEKREVRRTLDNKIPEDAVRTPDEPITLGAIRLEVTWQESMAGDNSALVMVGTLIAPGQSYSGLRPETGDLLIVKGLTEAAFEDRDSRIIEVHPPLTIPEKGIPEMTLLKLVD